ADCPEWLPPVRQAAALLSTAGSADWAPTVPRIGRPSTGASPFRTATACAWPASVPPRRAACSWDVCAPAGFPSHPAGDAQFFAGLLVTAGTAGTIGTIGRQPGCAPFPPAGRDTRAAPGLASCAWQWQAERQR